MTYNMAYGLPPALRSRNPQSAIQLKNLMNDKEYGQMTTLSSLYSKVTAKVFYSTLQ